MVQLEVGFVDKASHSEVETYLACQRRHYYQYFLRLQTKSTSDNLARGNVGHECLSCYYSMRKDGLSHEDAAMAALDYLTVAKNPYTVYDPDTLWGELQYLLASYFDYYEDDKFEVIETEILHNVEVTEDFIMPIKVDLVLDTPSGIVARDWKFTYDFYTVDRVDVSPQLPKYLAALHSLGIKPDSIEYDQIRYRTTKANAANPAERFTRTPIPLSADKVTRIMAEQFRVGRRIGRLRGMPIEDVETNAVRNASACTLPYKCPFIDLCVSDLNGGHDSQLLMENFYEERPRS